MGMFVYVYVVVMYNERAVCVARGTWMENI